MSILSNGPYLYIDTTASVLQLALGLPGQPELISVTLPCDSHRYHSARITPALQDLLDGAGLKPADLKALVVNVGPGSFTGVRTGVVTVRTMAQFLPIPVYTCNTLQLWAWRHFQTTGKQSLQPVAVYLDALRGRAFHAVYGFDANTSTLKTLVEPGLAVLAPFTRPGMVPELSTEPLPLPTNTQLMAPASLHPILENRGFELLPVVEELNTPELMRSLLSVTANQHPTPWPDLLPLYLQEPSITLKPGFVPPQVGTTSSS